MSDKKETLEGKIELNKDILDKLCRNEEEENCISMNIKMRFRNVDEYKYKLNVLASSFIDIYGCENRYINGVISGLKIASHIADELLDTVEDEDREEEDDIEYGDENGRADSIHFVIRSSKPQAKAVKATMSDIDNLLSHLGKFFDSGNETVSKGKE